MWKSLFLLPCLCFAKIETMLESAQKITALYDAEITKAPPPSRSPMPDLALSIASTWLHIDLNELSSDNDENPIAPFSQEQTWQIFREIGFDGVRMQNLALPENFLINPRWKTFWPKIVENSRKLNISLIGDLIGNATAPSLDFQYALQMSPDYLNLYNLVEIDEADWKLLPNIPPNASYANVPWLTIQELYRRGYVPEQFSPMVKESSWNATGKIAGVDGKTRRWIYLKEGKNNPVLSWLSPTFASYRLATGDSLYLSREIGQKILHIDGNLPYIAEETLSLWARKIGCVSAASTNGTIESMKNASADLIYDASTRPALLHALIAQDAMALRLIYQIMLESGVEAKRLVHVLQPFDQSACDWVEFMLAPKKKFQYAEEQITGEVLRQRLLKEDLYRLQTPNTLITTTWVDHCARALGIQDFEAHKEEITNAHLLLSFVYAMQPGAFSLSTADLLGALPQQANSLNLFGVNPKTLYASLPSQLKNPRSFASKLKSVLQARRESNIAAGELISVLNSPNRGTLLLLYRLPVTRYLYLLAVNFGRKAVVESVEIPEISKTTAIDILKQLAEEKVFSSAQFSFTLSPLCGRAFYFQPKFFN